MMIIIIIVKPQCGQTDRGSGFGHSLIALSLYSGRARLMSKYWRDMKSSNTTSENLVVISLEVLQNHNKVASGHFRPLHIVYYYKCFIVWVKWR